MEVQEYANRYIEMIKVAVTRLYPECDLTSQRSLNLLYNEYQLAVQEYEYYVSIHKHKPDHAVLMDHFEKWGIDRSDLFQENERVISEEDFINYYLAYVNNGKWLKVTEFTKEDYRFILKREAYLARKLFRENCLNMNGYQELDIRRSKKRQEYCLRVLKSRFEEDYAHFYSGMKMR